MATGSGYADDFKGECGLWAKTYGTYGVDQVMTKSYSKWSSMRYRCTDGSCAQKHRPTYIGCAMSKCFSSFQFFTDWHVAQVGYSESYYHLDKDILFAGNKLYSEDTCILVPRALNMFLTAHKSNIGLYPQGVYLDKKKRKFMAKIIINSKNKYLGRYTTQEDAALAYKIAKEAEAYRWYERLRDGEFVVDERVIERMRTWTLND